MVTTNSERRNNFSGVLVCHDTKEKGGMCYCLSLIRSRTDGPRTDNDRKHHRHSLRKSDYFYSCTVS